MDPETRGLLDKHRRMLRDKAPSDVLEPVEEELRGRLGRFADTSTERLAQGIAAELMHERRPWTAEDRQEARGKILQRVRHYRG